MEGANSNPWTLFWFLGPMEGLIPTSERCVLVLGPMKGTKPSPWTLFWFLGPMVGPNPSPWTLF